MPLQGAVAELDREREGLLARRHGAVGVSRHRSTWAIRASTCPSRARSSSALASASASPNRARCRPYSPSAASGRSQSEAELEGQHPGVAVLGQVREGLEGLLEGGHRLAECGAVVGPGTGLLAVGHGLVPHLAPQGMVRQAVDLLGRPLGRECFKSLDDAPVQRSPPLQQEATVGHLVRQGVLEGVF